MGNVCCEADIKTSALQTNALKANQYVNSILPANDGVLKGWLEQNNITIAKNNPNEVKNSNKPTIMKHKDFNRYYYGIWSDGILEGNGLIYEPEKVLFSGHFHKGVPEGRANIKLIEEGYEYHGEVKNGKAHGEGTIDNFKKKYRFSGMWEGSRPKKGILTLFNDSNISTIQFENFSKGKGTIIYRDNRRYEGDISTQRLVPDGKGKVFFPSNSNKVSYDGDWVNGVMHGRGRFLWADGSSYKGEFLNGRRQGYGSFTFPTGSHYEGFWLNGKQASVGTLYDKHGNQLKKGKWLLGIYDSQIDQQAFKKQNEIFQQKIEATKKNAQQQLYKIGGQQNKRSIFQNDKSDQKNNFRNTQKVHREEGQNVSYY